MTYSFDFLGDTTFAGKLGFLAEVYGGLEWSSGFALVGQIGLGGMKADSAGLSVAVSLVELSIRAQYAFMPLNKVRPVVEFGGGMYRARSGTVLQGTWTASFFLMGGAGADVTFAPKVVGEFRIGNRQQFESTSSHANGHVASLFYFGAGVRARGSDQLCTVSTPQSLADTQFEERGSWESAGDWSGPPVPVLILLDRRACRMAHLLLTFPVA